MDSEPCLKGHLDSDLGQTSEEVPLYGLFWHVIVMLCNNFGKQENDDETQFQVGGE
jgi:hypothetical protein